VLYELSCQALQSKFDKETDPDKKEMFSRMLTKISSALSITESALNNSSSGEPLEARAQTDVQKVNFS